MHMHELMLPMSGATHPLQLMSSSTTATSLMQAYVQFRAPESATLAKDAIHGRMFAGAVVQVSYLSDLAFDRITDAG